MSTGYRHGEYDHALVAGNVGSFSIEDTVEGWRNGNNSYIWVRNNVTHGNEAVWWLTNDVVYIDIESGVSTAEDVFAVIGTAREHWSGPGPKPKTIQLITPGIIVSHYLFFFNQLSNYYRFGGVPAVWVTSPSISILKTYSVTFSGKSDTNGFVYTLVLPKDSVAPTSSEIVASYSSKTEVVANSTFTSFVGILDSDTEYDAYIVAEYVLQTTPVKISFKSAPTSLIPAKIPASPSSIIFYSIATAPNGDIYAVGEVGIVNLSV